MKVWRVKAEGMKVWTVRSREAAQRMAKAYEKVSGKKAKITEGRTR